MSLQGEYVPSPAQWVRDQVDAYERSSGQEANTLRDTGLPVIIVTTKGNKTGFIRKFALMRVEHDGAYALVASKGGSPPPPNRVVWCRGLVRTFGSQTVLDGVDLDVAPGTIVGLIGPSGCGKTTLLRTLLGIYQPTSGEVAVLGHTPHEFTPSDRAR